MTEPMTTDARVLAELLRAEAEACLTSSEGTGEYNTAFYVASIVLRSLANRLDILISEPNSHD